MSDPRDNLTPTTPIRRDGLVVSRTVLDDTITEALRIAARTWIEVYGPPASNTASDALFVHLAEIIMCAEIEAGG